LNHADATPFDLLEPGCDLKDELGVRVDVGTWTRCSVSDLGGLQLYLVTSSLDTSSGPATRQVQKAHLQWGILTDLPAWTGSEDTRLRDERRHWR
jgi:hypothetical protein